MKNIFLRTKQLAYSMLNEPTTIRSLAKRFGMAKSTVHYDLCYRLPAIDYSLYCEIKKILDKNFEEKSERGGMATKLKYEILKQKKWALNSFFLILSIICYFTVFV